MIYRKAICVKCGHRWIKKSTNPRCPIRTCRSPMVNFVDEVESVEERLDELENAVNTIMKRLVEIS